MYQPRISIFNTFKTSDISTGYLLFVYCENFKTVVAN